MEIGFPSPPALKQLAGTCDAVTDDVLDLFLDVKQGKRAGACVSTYFRLKRSLPHDQDTLAQIGSWLESMIFVEARQESEGRVGRLPLDLAGASELEDYCRQKMREVFLSGEYPSSGRLQLEFRYADRL